MKYERGHPRYWVSWRDERGDTGDTRAKYDIALAIARRYKRKACWALVIDMTTYRRVLEYGTPFRQLPPMEFPNFQRFEAAETRGAA